MLMYLTISILYLLNKSHTCDLLFVRRPIWKSDDCTMFSSGVRLFGITRHLHHLFAVPQSFLYSNDYTNTIYWFHLLWGTKVIVQFYYPHKEFVIN